MGETLGAPLERIGRLDPVEVDDHPNYQPGWARNWAISPWNRSGTTRCSTAWDHAPCSGTHTPKNSRRFPRAS